MSKQKNSSHIPVLLDEVLEGLNIRTQGIYVDLTIGRAGHGSEILKRIPEGMLYGFDQDQEAIVASEAVLKKIGNNFSLVHRNFHIAANYLARIGVTEVDGVLIDLGVSSPQLDVPERGFSYHEDGPLDMRMDQGSQTLTAATIVNTYSLHELVAIFRDYGEEKFAYSIAKNIVASRKKRPINTTLDLVEIIKKSLPAKVLAKPGHPARKTFQALRIAVNDELTVLEETLESMLPLLKKKGRLAVISFHSLEDRIVKHSFKKLAMVEGNKRLPEQAPAAYRLVNRKIIVPREQELMLNPRAKSAKLRIIERI
ncbi:MAG: 16S rRNA (cytosine(1402)-N(4))-methyltransferase RsmH [Bacilli bacterium]|jgi:16S rRNA (cytosine1402-N4)-methyltransferase